jgi:hypothetical protein
MALPSSERQMGLAMKKMSRTLCILGDLNPDPSIARFWHEL